MHDGIPVIGINPGHLQRTHTFDKALAKIREMGFASIELTTDPTAYKGGLDLMGDVTGVRNKLEQQGIRVYAITANNDFISQDQDELDRQMAHVNWCVDLAVEFDAVAVRFLGGQPKEGIAERSAIKMMVECTEQVAAYAELHGIKLGLENVGQYTNRLEIQLQVIERVNAPMLGATLNPGNYLRAGRKPKEIMGLYQKLAHHVVHTHLTDFAVGENGTDEEFVLGDGEAHLGDGMRLLLDAGYNGDFIVHTTEDTKPADVEAGFGFVRSQLPRRIYSYI